MPPRNDPGLVHGIDCPGVCILLDRYKKPLLQILDIVLVVFIRPV